MREVSGSMWTFQIIIIFIFIFACFLSLVISYSRAYTVKNRMLNVVEKYGGMTEESLDVINMYTNEKGYKTKGFCPSDVGESWYGVDDMTLGEHHYEEAQSNKQYYFCYKENSKNGKVYYSMRVFYKFNLPFFGELAIYKVSGETQTFKSAPKEDLLLK